MNQDFIECGYFYKDSHSYTIAIDKDLKKHYFSNDKGKKEVGFFEKEELEKIFNPDYGNNLLEPKSGFFIPTGIPTEYSKYVDKFTQKMEYIFLSLGLNYDNKIKRSLRSLSVIDNELSCFENNFAVGIYDAKYNRLFINPSINNLFGDPIFEAVFSHELFHGITTKRDIANMAIGFYHVKDNLGIGLTELSTQYFIGKFIGGRKEYYNVFDIKLMDKLLSIVGYPLFLNYIFNNDTNGLINHFANYIGISEAIRLMLLIDNYYYSARSFNESLMLTNIASAFSTDSILSEIYRKIDQKVQADICRDKYEKSIMTLIYQMQNYKKDINPIESGKII